MRSRAKAAGSGRPKSKTRQLPNRFLQASSSRAPGISFHGLNKSVARRVSGLGSLDVGWTFQHESSS